MNTWMVLGLVAVLVFVALKAVKGIIKTIIWIIVLALLFLAANYFLLPKLDKKPVNFGLDKFFKSQRKEVRKLEGRYKEDLSKIKTKVKKLK